MLKLILTSLVLYFYKNKCTSDLILHNQSLSKGYSQVSHYYKMNDTKVQFLSYPGGVYFEIMTSLMCIIPLNTWLLT